MDTDQSLLDSTAALAHRCQEEMQKFRNDQPNDDRPCLELFRRAILDRSEEAWRQIVKHYQTQVQTWVVRYLAFSPPQQEIESLTQDAFARFWRYYNEQAWHRARGLGQVLAYLKTCAHSAVAQLHREQENHALETPLDTSRLVASHNPISGLEAKVLWGIVTEHCQDEADLILARQVLTGNLKPRHVFDFYPHLFTDVREVYRRKRNLLERLQRDTRLVDEFGS